MLGILAANKLDNATDEQKFRCLLAISVAFTVIINDLGKGKVKRLIDEVTDRTKRVTQNLTFRIRDAAADDNKLQIILSNFPAVTKVTVGLRTNGMTLLPILFNSLGPSAIKDIMTNTGGPVVATGYAAIVVGNFVVGKEKARSEFLEICHYGLLHTHRAPTAWFEICWKRS